MSVVIRSILLITDPELVSVADINKNGQPDTDDALAILRYVATGGM